MSSFSAEDIAELIECLKGTDFTEVRLVYGGVELWVTRNADGLAVRRVETWHEKDDAVATAPVARAGTAPAAPASNPATAPTTPASPVQEPAAAAPTEQDGGESDIAVVTSPMLGTFYVAPSPSEPPFVAVGDKVETGAVVGIVEAMKLMTQVHSAVAGEIVEVLVTNEDLVEYGQPLMRVRTT